MTLSGCDLLIAFSDGVIEAFDKDGELFGSARLALCLFDGQERAPAALLDDLFETINQFRGGADKSDDLSALAIRYEGG